MKEQKFSSALVKIGNSYAVRIPMHIIRTLDAQEGDMLVLKAEKASFELTNQILELWYKKARECKELKDMSDEKIILYSRLSYNEGIFMKEHLDKKYRHAVIDNVNDIENNLTQKQIQDIREQGSKAKEKYKKQIIQEFGEKIYNEFLYFRKIVDPKFKKTKQN